MEEHNISLREAQIVMTRLYPPPIFVSQTALDNQDILWLLPSFVPNKSCCLRKQFHELFVVGT